MKAIKMFFEEKFNYRIIEDVPAETLDEFCRENKPTAAVLCIPKEQAKSIADQLVKLGIKGIWNFSHYDFGIEYPQITVENMHFGDSLMTLSYKLNSEE